MHQNNLSENLNNWEKISGYSQWMFNLYRKYIGQSVFDIGAGIGNMTNYYIRDCTKVVACDIFADQVESMNERFQKFNYFNAIKFNIIEDEVQNLKKELFDTILCINVIEHLSDDFLALSKMKELVIPGGKIILLAPACPKLYCYMDKNVGHYRRYQKGQLKLMAEQLQLNIIDNRYFNFFGIFPYYFKGKFGKDQGGSYSTELNGVNSRIFNIASKILEPVEYFIKPVRGISELIILEK